MHVNDRAEPFSAWRPDLHIPGELEQIVLKMLEKEPLDRYQSVQAVLHDLVQFSKSKPNLELRTPSAGDHSGSRERSPKGTQAAHLAETSVSTALPDFPIIDAVLKVLIKANIITGEDAKAAMTLHQWNGGSPVQYLVEFGCISPKTHESSLQCLDMMDRYSLSLEDAAMTLMYCHKRGISVEDALAEVE
jgi:serine/threonine protein kinase